MSNWKFGFSGNAGKIPLKPTSWRYLDPDYRGFIGLQDNDMVTIGTYVPLYTLPVCMIGGDTRATEDYTKGYGRNASTAKVVVIPQGTIVSLMSIKDSDTVPGANDNVSGFLGSTINTMYGVPEGINSWSVPANGGSDATYTYSELDAEIENLKNSAGDLAADGDTVTIPANKPVGIAFHDILHTRLKGQYLNFSQMHPHGIMTEGYIQVPFYKGNLATDLGANYAKVARKYAFAYLNTASDTPTVGFRAIPDSYGKFKLAAYSDIKTAGLEDQVVGIAMEYEWRGPGAMNDMAMAFPGSASTNNQTGGYLSHLYYFAVDVLYIINGSIPTKDDVVAAIENGTFGFANIYVQLL